MKADLEAVLLLRTTSVGVVELAFAEELHRASGHPVAFVADVRHTGVLEPSPCMVPLSKAACQKLHLYCPDEFAWQCGDYGYYLARHQFPDVEYFWMIEHDVRFLGGDAESFFRFFDARREVDFLATGLMQADESWHWSSTARARNVKPYRCLFPVTRLSARAVDAALARRVSQSRSPLRRRLWPNDEALIATTLMNDGFVCKDFNAFGRTFYDFETFSFYNPINGDALASQVKDTRMLHPVLFGAAYHAKLARLQEKAQEHENPASWRKDIGRRLMVKIAGQTDW